jgi:septal ring factor EnvC (AmiA/AmiB activator)
MLKSNRTGKTIVATVLVALFSVAAGSAMAETKWEKAHPRRDQVNDRLARQNKRIQQERKEDDITKAQAQALHKEDRQIRQEEQDMASQNGGHITKSEKAALNQQENAVSKQIGK